MVIRITQDFLDVLTQNDSPNVVITQEFIEVLVLSNLLTPNIPATLSLSVIDPTVVAGSGTSITPSPATVAVASVAGIVSYGSLVITPSPRVVNLRTVDGIIIAGNLSITPAPALVKLGVFGPDLSVTVSPSPISVSLSTTRNEIASSVASLPLSTISPTIVLGSHSATPQAASAALDTTPPTVVAPGSTLPYALAFMVA